MIQKIDSSRYAWRTMRDNSTLIYNLDNQKYCSVNETGTMIWCNYVQGVSVDRIAKYISSTFDLDSVQAYNDIHACLNGIASAGRMSTTGENPNTLSTGDILADHLHTVQINATNRCNFNCIHCLRPAQIDGEELSFSEIVDIIDMLVDMQVFYLTFSGGEFFVRDDCLDLISYARSLGFSVAIVTNGSLLTRDLVDRLQNLGISYIRVSLYGESDGVYNRVTNTIDQYQKVNTGISYLKDAGIKFGIAIPILKNHVEFSMYKRMEAKYRKLTPYIGLNMEIVPSLDGSRNSLEYRVEDGDSFERFAVLDWEMRQPKLSGEAHFCGAARSLCTIEANGDVKPCGMFPYSAGNVRKGKLPEIWHESELMKELRAMNINQIKCNECHIKEHCTYQVYCYARSIHESGDICIPPAINCAKAKIVKAIKGGESSR